MNLCIICISFQFKKQNTEKYWRNRKKYWKSQGILSVRKSGNHVVEICRYLGFYQKAEIEKGPEEIWLLKRDL